MFSLCLVPRHQVTRADLNIPSAMQSSALRDRRMDPDVRLLVPWPLMGSGRFGGSALRPWARKGKRGLPHFGRTYGRKIPGPSLGWNNSCN